MEIENSPYSTIQNPNYTSNLSKSMAMLACTILTLLYVAILHSPTLILRLSPPNSYNQFMIRRFFCALFSSIFSLILSSFLLFPIQSWNTSNILLLYGIRVDHIWHAVFFPILLTSLMYAGSLVLKCLSFLDCCNEDESTNLAPNHAYNTFHKIRDTVISLASNISAWRNLVVAPITEELVFRACMIPLLLCGGFRPQTVVFLCPVFFSLAHLNHLFELYIRKNNNLTKTLIAVGTQLAYTMIFGSYASFLFVRTGHLTAPLVAHTVCNFMGLPVVYHGRKGLLVSLAFVVGAVCYLNLVFPLTRPSLYNTKIDNCHCWQGYCRWI